MGVCYYLVESLEGTGFAAAMGCSWGLYAEFCCSGDGEVVVWTGEFGIGFVWLVTLDAVDVWVWVRLFGLDGF